MKNSKIKNKYKTDNQLRFIGEWATVWWALSGLFLVILIVQMIVVYGDFQTMHSASPSWWYTFIHTFKDHLYIYLLAIIVFIGWVLCGIAWVRALREAKISYKDGLRDLFLTIR